MFSGILQSSVIDWCINMYIITSYFKDVLEPNIQWVIASQNIFYQIKH